MAAHADLGDTLYHLGELVPARAHYAQALALSTSQQDAALTGRAAGWWQRLHIAERLPVPGH